jgi:outer membrane protein assembly factor BamB
MRYLAALLACLASASLASAADNWPEHRGSDNGKSDARGLPIHWSEKDNIRWKTPIHDKGWSSPVVWGDQIWLTTAREDGKELYALCIDRSSGKILRDEKMYEIKKPEFCHPFNSYASPTPALEEGRVYIHFGTYGTCCLDTKSYKKLWERRDLHCDHFRGPGASPIIYGDLLILSFDGFDVQYVIALNKKTGETVWKKDRGITDLVKNGDMRKAYATARVIEVGGKPLLIVPGPAATMAYDPKTGEEIWRVVHGGMNVSARPLYGFDRLFLTTGDQGMQLLALRPEGKGDITGNIDWKTTKGVPTRSSMLLIDDLLYMVANQGVASCLEAKTGKPVWQERVGKNYCASPVYAEGRLYFASQEGEFHVLAAGREAKVLAVNKLDAGCMASPAIVGKSLIVRTKTHLYCIEQGK